MEHLWAPWRMEFIERPGDKSEGCIFCDLPARGDDARTYIVYRGARCFIMLNGFPYNNGHLLVSAYRHTAELHGLSAHEMTELMQLTDLGCRAIDAAYHPQGYNIGMNLGQVAGAGVPGHLHIHIVPRWNGDTNFMPVLSGTRVLPEALAESYRRLKVAFLGLPNGVPE